MSSNVLSARDVNTSAPNLTTDNNNEAVKSMEYHRQVLQSKLSEDG